jgi:hypothetical protein
MNPEVIYGGCTVAGAVVGWIARGAYNAGRLRSMVDQHSESIKGLAVHAIDTDMHMVRGREDRVISTLHEAVNNGFQGVYRRLDNIDSRCEHRLSDCQQHFSRVDTKIAAGPKGGEAK